MEINLRNVPFSEELLFFIRRCAGEARGDRVRTAEDLEVRLRRIDVPARVYETCLLRRHDAEEGDVVIVETDPDPYLSVRNAFEILKARERRERDAARGVGRAACDGAANLQ